MDFSGDDLGLELSELRTMSGFLMNETPDSTGHFYPPWATDVEPLIKDEPLAVDFATSKSQQQSSLEEGAGGIATAPKVDISLGPTVPTLVNSTSAPGRFATGTIAVPAAPSLKKNASGGVPRRRSSSKEEQAKKRRERNRVLARRTRLRKKFFFQSLQQQVMIFVVFRVQPPFSEYPCTCPASEMHHHCSACCIHRCLMKQASHRREQVIFIIQQ